VCVCVCVCAFALTPPFSHQLTKIKNTHIGTTVMCNIYGSHHHPKYWERPDQFDPMRFSVSRERTQHRPATPAFFPFGYGGHSCIGKNLAQIATMTIAAKLVASFQLLPKPETRSPKFNTTNSTQIFGFMEPIGGVWIRPERRHIVVSTSQKTIRENVSEKEKRHGKHSNEDITKRLTWDEIRKHTTQESCWIVLNEKVYDVTSFLSVHPGGKRILLGQAGKDATSMFKAIAHSTFAVEESEKYYIGDLNGERIVDGVSRL
jgi:cytochrome b involved in lipid metabolism